MIWPFIRLLEGCPNVLHPPDCAILDFDIYIFYAQDILIDYCLPTGT